MAERILWGVLLLLLAGCQAGTKSEKVKTSQEVAFTEVSLSVGGMTCAMCVASVEKGISQLEGIDSLSVVLSDSTAYIRFDPEKVSEDDITQAIGKRGYKVKARL